MTAALTSARALPGLPLRPLSPVEIVDVGFALVRAKPILLVVGALFVVPVQLVAIWLDPDLSGGGGFGVISSIADSTGEADPATASALWALTASSLVLPFTAASIGRLVVAWYEERPGSLREILPEIVRRSWAISFAWLVVHVLEWLGVLTLGIGTLWAMTIFAVTAPACAIERVGPLRAMNRSRVLVKGRGVEVLWGCVLVGLVALVAQLSMQVLPAGVELLIGVDLGWLTTAVVNVVATTLTTTVVAAAAVAQYLDLRCRHEGLDLEIRAVDVLGAK